MKPKAALVVAIHAGPPAVRFPVPEGFNPPDSAQGGNPFDALASLKLVGDALELVAIDGVPVHPDMPQQEPDGDEGPEPEEPSDNDGDETADPEDFMDALRKGMKKHGIK
jgi:hypothetical protein